MIKPSTTLSLVVSSARQKDQYYIWTFLNILHPKC